ncbi:MAG: antitoxin [Propionibacteriaceae bacterium]
MGIFDKAKDLIGQHNDKVDQGIDKAGDVVDQKTGGTHGSQIDQGGEALKSRLDDLNGDDASATPAGETPTDQPPANEAPAAPPVS